MAKKPKVEEPELSNPANLLIDGRYLREGELEKYRGASDADIAALSAELSARAMSQPEVRAASVIQTWEGDSLDVNCLVNELRVQVAEVSKGSMARPEAILTAQAHTLDALFGNLARRSKTNASAGYLDAAERYMRLALKAQSQCRTTLEALAEIKSPRHVAFVKQANIAHGPQQVNNGSELSARENTIQSNELSGAADELLPDTRASQAASRIDTPMEAVGEIYGAAN